MSSQKVLVVGGGPAGCATALTLLKNGIETEVYELGNKYREKACGDCLAADAQQALRSLNVFDKICLQSLVLPTLTFMNQATHFSLQSDLYSLQRSVFDQILRDEVITWGGKVYYGKRIQDISISPTGVVLEDSKGEKANGDCVVLATGASNSLAQKVGFQFTPHDIVAFRLYADNTPKIKSYTVWFDKSLSEGYGWLFPVPGGKLNIGLGFIEKYHAFHATISSLKDSFFKTLREKYNLTGLESMRTLGGLLRTGLRRSSAIKDRVLLVGELVNTTYALTGEGIGKALQSGIIAGEVIAKALPDYSASSLQAYDERIRKDFTSIYDGYNQAASFLSNSLSTSFSMFLFAHSNKLRSRLEAILQERADPRDCLSLSGIAKTLIFPATDYS